MGFWSEDELHGYGCYIGVEKNLIGEYRNGMMNGVGYTHELDNDKWEYGIFKNYLVDTAYTFYDNNVDTGCVAGDCQDKYGLSLIHISEPTRRVVISYAVFCLKKKT